MSCAIIIRTKNRNLLLRRALVSIVEQTYKDWYVVIINDGGDTDHLEELIGKFKFDLVISDIKIKVIHNQSPQGMEAAANLGIQNSQSEYIAFLDDDDTWEPRFLELSISTLKSNPSYKGVACRSRVIREVIVGNKIKTTLKYIYNPKLSYVNLLETCMENRFTNHSFVYYRECLVKVGQYNEELPVLGDWEFNIRFLMHYDIIVLPMVLANYHIRDRSHSESCSNTVICKRNLHLEYKNLIRNSYLRKYINEGIGIGFLVGSFGLSKKNVENIFIRVVRKIINFTLSNIYKLILRL